jgi:protein SCO1/2
MTNKTSAKKNILFKVLVAIAVAFLVPLSFFVLAKVGKKDKLPMPRYYLTDGVDSAMVDGKVTYDTLYHHVGDIQLTNQLGRTVSLNKDLKDKILVVNFFFARCPSVCPKLSGNMHLLQQAFRKDPKKEFEIGKEIQLISITVDPAHDSFQVLRAYADRYNADHDKWWFLTGNRDSIYNYARNELALAVQPTTGGAEDFIHTQKIVILDRERHVRGYYDGLDTAAVNNCAEDVVKLVLEKGTKK